MKSPLNYAFVAATAATHLKGRLYRFEPSRTGESPTWDGHGEPITASAVPAPITDKSWWADRYALCCLTLRREDGDTLTLPDAVVSISRARSIVMTQMVGMDGTVKEYIGEEDYRLNIAIGVAATENGVLVDAYPEEGLRRLRQFFDVKEPIACHSALLDIFGISRIVIKEYSLTGATESNYQTVSVGALSDEPYNVYRTAY